MAQDYAVFNVLKRVNSVSTTTGELVAGEGLVCSIHIGSTRISAPETGPRLLLYVTESKLGGQGMFCRPRNTKELWYIR